MDDAGKIHAIEAVLVGAMLFSAAGFILTLEQDPVPQTDTLEKLRAKGQTALATFYDEPLDNPKYGNNTMSKAVAESMTGDTKTLTDRLDLMLPPGVEYNVYLDNGYGSYPVKREASPPGESVTSSRLLEPDWTYTFLSTDVEKYPVTSDLQPARMGVYALPVTSSTPTDPGGTTVDVVVEGEITEGAANTGQVVLESSHLVVQHEAGTPDPIPHASVTFTDSPGGSTVAFANDTHMSTGETIQRNLTIEETAGQAIPSGTHLNVTVPQGWTATASNQTSSDWTVVRNKTDETVRGDLEIELDTDIEAGVTSSVDVEFDTTLNHTEYDYYVHQASLGSPAWGTARLLVQVADSGTYTAGDFPDVHLTAPRSMGTDETGSWALAVKNPTPFVGDRTIEIDTVEVETPAGEGIFADVVDVSSPCGSASEWTVVTPSKLRWDGNRSHDACSLQANDELTLVFDVESSGNGTERGEMDTHDPPASFPNGHDATVDQPVTKAMKRLDLPPATGDWSGWDDSSGTHTITSSSVYPGDLSQLNGSIDYDVESINTYKDALAMGRFNASPGKAPLGTTVDLKTNAQALLFYLADQGFSANLTTRVYPPWTVGDLEPIMETNFMAQTLSEADIVGVELHDVNGDGTDDVLVASSESKIIALDGEDGSKLTDPNRVFLDRDSTVFEKVDVDATASTTTRFFWGFVGSDGDDVMSLDEDLENNWTRDLQSGARAVTAENDYTGDDVKDVAVALDDGSRHLLDGTDGSTIWSLPIHDGPAVVAEGEVSEDATQSVLSSVGTQVDISYQEVEYNTSGYAETSRGDVIDGDAEADDLDMDPVEFLKSVSISKADAGFVGTDADGNTTYEWRAPSYKAVDIEDADRNDVDDIVGGRWDGIAEVVNGTESHGEYAWLTIASGNYITDGDAYTRDHQVTVTRDGMFYYTRDAWTSTHYYWEGPMDSGNLLNFPYATEVDLPNLAEAWVTWGIGGSKISYSDDGYQSFSELDYDIYETHDKQESLDTDIYDIEGIRWHDSLSTYGVMFGGKCDAAQEITELDTELDCSDAFFAWNPSDEPHENWIWSNMSGETDGHQILDFHFPEGQVVVNGNEEGFAAGRSGGFYYTDDAGESWTFRGVDPHGDVVDTDLHAVHFLDTSEGFVAGDDGRMFHTTDAGQSWEEVDTGVHADLKDIHFHGDMGIAVGNQSTVIRTGSGGDTWYESTTGDLQPSGWSWDPALHNVELVSDDAGWIYGGDSSGGVKRLIGSMTSWDRNNTVRSQVLTDSSVTNISQAEVRGDHRYPNSEGSVDVHVSNDGCSGWSEVKWSTAGVMGKAHTLNFSDDTGDDLCWMAYFNVTRKSSDLRSPRLYDINVSVNQSTDDGDTWVWENYTMDFTDTSDLDLDASTAVVETSGSGFVRNPIVETFWQRNLGGSVNTIDVADYDGDGDDDVAVGTGDEWEELTQTTNVSEDRRVYIHDLENGTITAESAKLDGRVVTMETVTLPTASGDSDPDLLVATASPPEDDTKSGTYRLYALTETSGSLDIIWQDDIDAEITDIEAKDTDGDGTVDAVVGTKSGGSDTASSGITRRYEADTDPEEEIWTAYPSVKRRFTATFDVDRNLPFGAYVAESEVRWENSTVTQSARFYDAFTVAKPDGTVPESPLYRVELVSWYPDG